MQAHHLRPTVWNSQLQVRAVERNDVLEVGRSLQLQAGLQDGRGKQWVPIVYLSLWQLYIYKSMVILSSQVNLNNCQM